MRTTSVNNVKFIKFGFYKTKLTIFQAILIFSLFTIETAIILLDLFNYNLSLLKIICFTVLWWLPLFGGISNMFRNMYCSILWLIMCLMWLVIDLIPMFSIFPIFSFIYVHFARQVFKIVFKKEPVFMMLSRFESHYYNKIEKRKSNRMDFNFSMITCVTGVALSFLISKII